MFKSALRTLLFTFLAVKATQHVIGGFSFGGLYTFIWFVIALSVLFYCLRPILKLAGLPEQGPAYLFITFILTCAMLYLLTLFLPMFLVVSTVVSKLLIFGFVLPSKQLTAQWALVFSALLITVIVWFLGWLCTPKK